MPVVFCSLRTIWRVRVAANHARFCARLQGLVTLPCETLGTVTQGEYHESRTTHILRVLLVSYRTHRRTSDLWHHFYNTFQLHLLVSSPLSYTALSVLRSCTTENNLDEWSGDPNGPTPSYVKKIIFLESNVVRQTYVYNWEDITWHDVPQPREIICTQVNLVK